MKEKHPIANKAIIPYPIAFYQLTVFLEHKKFQRTYSLKADKDKGIKCDQIGKLGNADSLQDYPDKFRRIKYYDKELDREFVFITNNTDLSALEIALLYNGR